MKLEQVKRRFNNNCFGLRVDKNGMRTHAGAFGAEKLHFSSKYIIIRRNIAGCASEFESNLVNVCCKIYMTALVVTNPHGRNSK